VRHPSVLYVDDEQANQVVFELHFRDRYDVTLVADPREAAALLEQRSFDVLLTDQRMPYMTGVELCAVARRVQPDLERVLVTAYADKRTASKALNEGGVSAFVSKPWSPDAMVRTLDEASRATRQRRLASMLRETVRARARAAAIAAAQARLLHDIGNLAGLVNASTWNLQASLEDLPGLQADRRSGLKRSIARLEGVVEAMNGLLQTVRRLRAPGEGAEEALGEVDIRELLELVRLVSLPLGRQHGVDLAIESFEDGLSARGLVLDLAQVLSHVVEYGVLAAAGGDPAEVTLRVETDAERVRILVLDTGLPLSQAECEVAFELLHQDESMRPGVGQGLGICRRLAATGGGRLVLAAHFEGVVLELERSARGSL